VKLHEKMAVALDQQFKLEKKGIMEERIPILVNLKEKFSSSYFLLSI
jgi:hypothetical protein